MRPEQTDLKGSQTRFSFPFPKVNDKVIYFLLIANTKCNFAAEVSALEEQQLVASIGKLGGFKLLQEISGQFSVC